MGIAVCLLLAFVLSPTAHAAFTSLTSASTTISTAKLEAPARELTTVTISCGVLGLGLTITVKDYGRVAYANYHEVVLYRGTETQPAFVGDLSLESGRSYSELVRTSTTWRAEIRGRYKVINSANIWDGPPLKLSLSC